MLQAQSELVKVHLQSPAEDEGAIHFAALPWQCLWSLRCQMGETTHRSRVDTWA